MSRKLVPGEQPAGEAVASTTQRTSKNTKLTSAVWEEDFDYNASVAAGGVATATCRRCCKTMCAGGTKGTSHLHRHTKTQRCRARAAQRQLAPPAVAESSPLADHVTKVANNDEGGLFAGEIQAHELVGARDALLPAMPAAHQQALSLSTRRFLQRAKQRRNNAESKKRLLPDEFSLDESAQGDSSLGGKRMYGTTPLDHLLLPPCTTLSGVEGDIDDGQSCSFEQDEEAGYRCTMRACGAPLALQSIGHTSRKQLKSKVWERFVHPQLCSAATGEDKAICKRCHKTLSADSGNGTTHLWRHTRTAKCTREATALPVIQQLPQKVVLPPVADESSPSGVSIIRPVVAAGNIRLTGNNDMSQRATGPPQMAVLAESEVQDFIDCNWDKTVELVFIEK